MFKKVISEGQTEAGRAGLRFAKEVGIPSVPGSPLRSRQNALESDGTLIICCGELTGELLRMRKLVEREKRPCLVIDLASTNGLTAAGKIVNWIDGFGIEVLNITGQESSDNPRLYQDALKLLRAAYYMAALLEALPGDREIFPAFPGTIEEALESLTAGMSLKEKTRLARMDEGELTFFHPALAAYINEKFGLSAGNRNLVAACRTASGIFDLDESGASVLIIKRLFEKLRATHSLRVVTRRNVSSSF